MSIFRRTLIAATAAAALTAPFAAFSQDIKPRLIRFGYGLNEQSNQGRAVKLFADEVEKASGGKMKVRAIGAAALGSDVQMQQALIGGAQEMMVGSTATLVGITKEMAIWDTPFLFNNTKEADTVLDGPTGQKVMDKLQEKGLVGLVYWENGFRNLTNNKQPVNKLEDLNGIKLRVMQNNVFLESFKTLGANAVPLPFSELFTALETKTVDGQENPYNTILSSKFYEVQKYLTVTNHVYSPWIVTVSKKWWDGLSNDEKKVLMDAARKSRDFERQDTRAEAGKALGELKAKGMQINELSPAEANRMRSRVNASIATNVGMDLWNEAQAAVSNARRQVSEDMRGPPFPSRPLRVRDHAQRQDLFFALRPTPTKFSTPIVALTRQRQARAGVKMFPQFFKEKHEQAGFE